MQVLTHEVELRGAALQMANSRAKEVLISGAAGTGKSRAVLEKIHLICLLTPGVKALILRKTARSLATSALRTWERDVIPEAMRDGTVNYYGGSAREPAQYRYSNGSAVVIGGLDDPMKVMSTEYDCLIGETLVDSPSRIERGYSRPYSGQLVTITTASGVKLTGTPNHPVFTDHGWVGLGSLRQGDHVIRRVRREQESGRGGDPYVTDQPATIAEVVRALTLANPGGAERIEAVAVDFHGDRPDGYVDVVATRGPFELSRHASFLDHLPQINSKGRELQQLALMSVGACAQASSGSLAAPVAARLLCSERGHACFVFGRVAGGFDVAAPCDVEIASPLGARVPDMAQRLALRRSAPLHAACGHFAFETLRPQPDRARGMAEPEFPFEVAPDRVAEVVFSEAGRGRHVYNLQTGDNWYLANEIVSHNCAFIQECTEVSEEDWESVNIRLRNGAISFQQLIGDCNPGHPTHWLLERAASGKLLHLVSQHEDNPRYFRPDGTPTREGVDYIARLDSLTGVRYLRLRKNIWAAAEGVIYDMFDPAIHVIDPFDVPPSWERIWSVDFGHTNPFVWQDWALDSDMRAYLVREIYMSGRLVEDHARQIRNLCGLGELDRNGRPLPYAGPARAPWEKVLPSVIVCDHDAEDRATLERHVGMGTIPAEKAVTSGIEAVAARYKLAGDGRPRLQYFRNALVERDISLVDRKLPTCTVDETPGYIWAPEPPSADRKQAQPVKRNDHGKDAERYFVCEADLHGRTNVRWG